MRLAHLADLHLGFRQYGRQNSQGINQREADVARSFRLAIDGVIAARPDAVVVAGDVFHSVRPTNPAILDSFNQFRRLRESLPDAPIVLVAGNHDTPRSVETGSILRLFEVIGDVHVITNEPTTLILEQLDLAVTGVPYAAVVAAGGSPRIEPEPTTRWNVKVQHSEIAGLLPGDRSVSGVPVEPGDLQAEQWDYVALGHYHIAQRVRPNAWFSGSLEYVTSNPWGELREKSPLAAAGDKGWLLVTLGDDVPQVEFHRVERARRHIDLDPIHAAGMGAEEIDAIVEERVGRVAGGVADQLVRLVVYDVPRIVARDLDHARIREIKARALHFRFDIRRPLPVREVGVTAPGRRQTLPDLVEDYLSRRPMSADVDRAALVTLGLEYLNQVESDVSES